MKLARSLLANGCDALNVLGTTGEATSFSLGQRKALMEAAAATSVRLTRADLYRIVEAGEGVPLP